MFLHMRKQRLRSAVLATWIEQSLYLLDWKFQATIIIKPSSIAVQPDLCLTWLGTLKTEFFVTRLICSIYILLQVSGKAPTRAYHSATLYRHELWIFGGVYPRPDPQPDGCSNDIHIFSPVMESWYSPIVKGEKPIPRSGYVCCLFLVEPLNS